MNSATDRRPGVTPRMVIPPARADRDPRTSKHDTSPARWEYAAVCCVAAVVGLAAGLVAVDRLTPKPVTSPPFSPPVVAGKGPR